MHVSLTAESLFHIGPLNVTNSLLTTWVVMAIMILGAVIFRLRLKKNPAGMQNVVEAAVEGFHGVVHSVADDEKKTRQFFPYVFTIFIFVLFNNWFGLLPGVGSIYVEQSSHGEPVVHEESLGGGEEDVATSDYLAPTEAHADEAGHAAVTPLFRPGSADLSFTLALAIAAVVLVQFIGVANLGGWGYFSRFLNFSNPIHFFVGLLEIVSEFSKMVSFSFRLFGNVFAGEVLLTVIISLAPFVVPMPFYALEIFVGVVQALVFAMLTLVFFRGASESTH